MKTLRAIAESERLRLAECVREPIRTPGAIQPHGVLLGLSPDAATVVLASENSALAFDAEPAALLGAPLDSLVGEAVAASIRELAVGAPNASNPITATLSGAPWDVIVHQADPVVIVEFEPLLGAAPSPAAPIVFDAIRRLSLLGSVAELRRETVRAVRQLSGYDRVMLYHFYPDGHGEVVAEECADDMEPFLGLHFPASDIPAQARDLYLTKLSRSIVSTEALPAPLVADAALTANLSVDLSAAELRAVSPYHLQFMRNMGQVSTLSFSLVREGALIGMITCAHRSERRLPFLLRSTLEMLANQVAGQLRSTEEIDRLTEASKARELRTVLVRQFAESADPMEGLLDGAVSLFDVIPADGAILSIDGAVRSVGVTPAAFDPGVEGLSPTETLGIDHPELAESWGNIAGFLMVPLRPGGYLALFRREVIHTVDWLGDLTSDNRPDPLSPRKSFSSWTQSVKGTAPAWGSAVHEVRELAGELESAMLRKAESHLVVAALNDSLTGLPNRRYLQEQLASELAVEDSTALLFIDLDRFKIVNDSMGHDVGDALLVQVARRLASVAREGDTVARLGGDEFVLICAGATLQQAQGVGERILEALREPVEIGGHTLVVSASIGVAVAEPGQSAAELLKLADLSMYRAKAGGGGRAAL